MVAPTEAPAKDDTVVLPEGVYRPGWKDPIQPPGMWGTARDLALGAGEYAIDLLQSPATILRDATSKPSGGDADTARVMQDIQHGAIGAKKWLRGMKTEYAQDQEERAKRGEEDEKGWLREAVGAVVETAPALLAAAKVGTGAAGAVYGLGSIGQGGLRIEEQLQDFTPEQIAKTERYAKYRERGMSDEAARQRIYSDMRNADAILPDLVANTVFGGVAGRMISKLGQRGVAQTMRARIMKNAMLDIPEAVVGGAASGAATEYGRQTSQMAGGFQEEGAYDTGAIQKAAIDIARPVSIISGAVTAGRSLRRPGPMSVHEQQQAQQRAQWEGTQTVRDMRDRVLGNQPAKEGADEMGMDLRLVAADNLGTPKAATPEQQANRPIAEAARAPWQPGEAPPPEGPRPINPEGSTATVTPRGNEAPIPPAGEGFGPGQREAPSAPVMPDTGVGGRVYTPEAPGAPHFPDVGAPRYDPEMGMPPREAEAPPVARAPPEVQAKPIETAPIETAPVEVAAAPAAVAPASKFTLDQLKERAADVVQTPDHGTMMKHIAEWQAANPGAKLSNRNEILAVNKAALKAERARVVAEQAEALKTKRAETAKKDAEEAGDKQQRGLAKKQATGYAALARDQAKKLKDKAKKTDEKTDKAPKEGVTPEGKAKDADTTTKKADEDKPADDKPDPNLVRAKLGLRPLGAGVTHGAAAEADIAALRQKREEGARAAWEPVNKGEKEREREGARTEGTANRRDTVYTEREQMAKSVVELHKPGSNAAAEIDHIESVLKDGKPGDAAVKEAVAGLVKDAKQIFDDYKARVVEKAGGKKHPVWKIAEKGGKSRATKKGEYHAHISDLNNFVLDANAAIAKGDHVKAKELALKYLEDSKLVREGDMRTLVEARADKNSAVSVVKKTYSNTEGKFQYLESEEINRLNPEERAVYLEEAANARKAEQEATGKSDTTRAQEDAGLEADVDAKLKANPVQPISRGDARAKGIPVPKRNAKGDIIFRNGKMVMIDPMYPTSTLDESTLYNSGKREPLNQSKVDDLVYALNRAARDVGLDKLGTKAISEVFRLEGEPVQRGTVKDVLRQYRPDDPILRSVFDAVYDLVKDMPVEIWSRDMMTAYAKHADPNRPGSPLGFYDSMSGMMALRRDAVTAQVVFHESIHAATSRALHGSQRLTDLVTKLQDIIETRYKGDIDITAETPWQHAIRGVGEGTKEGPKPNIQEFVAELFSRPELVQLLKQTNLTIGEARALKKLGYRADIGQNILKTLWQNFLQAIGFKSEQPNALKVAVDLLQDQFEREMYIRDTDAVAGRATGAFLNEQDHHNLFYADPTGGPGVVKAFQAGNFPEAAAGILRINEKGFPNEKSADSALKMLNHINQTLWIEEPSAPVTRVSNPQEVQSGVIDFIDKRFGAKAGDAAWQIDRKFATPLRKFVNGMAYTNDLGNTLEQGFQNILKPLKDAWSRRENFAQKYMDDSGANKLIDDIAKYKNAIKDRELWSKFENLLIRESYARTRADEELGVGANAHINAGDLKDRQAVNDHAKNRALLEEIKAKNPDLITLRNRIYDFTKAELENRNRVAVRDMLQQFKVAGTDNEVALRAFTKDVQRENSTMTAQEREMIDRVLKQGRESDAYRNLVKEADRVKAQHGENSQIYKDHQLKNAPKLARVLAAESKEAAAYKKTRDDIRNIVDANRHNGPHVPFARHGDHAVYAEYDVRPDADVQYKEIDPTADTHKQYAFKNLSDAEHFIDNVLGHPDIQVALRGGGEMIYDTRTGEPAAIWTVEKADGTAKTYESREEAEAAMGKGDEISKKNLDPKTLKQMRDDNLPTSHFETWHRVAFNPIEFTKFRSEREAHAYREKLNQDTGHPNFTTKVANVESPHDMIGRANVAYTTAEMKQWINRQEASPEYQRMDPSEKAEWRRKMQVEAARVTATAGRRTMNMPRDYAKGASTDILKGMIDYAGNNARAIADLTYRQQIEQGLSGAEGYVAHFRNQSGGLAGNHRARDEVMREIKTRLFAPPRVEDSWAKGVKRALQVSMISHLADTGYLIVNAIEPWVLGASISAARHGWAGAYGEMGAATRLLDVKALAKAAAEDVWAASKGEFGPNQYEKLLLAAVTGPNNTRGDGAGLARMLQHMFDKGLAARDVGMEVERIHDPSSSKAFQFVDKVDNVFRGVNTGVETFNRALMAVSNFRLEMKRGLADGLSHEKAEAQAIRYAEDSIFKGAGDYGAWNNPRYFSNPFMKMALQFKKYPLRIFSVYSEAMIHAARGDRQAQKQLAYMLLTQAAAAGAAGLPFAAGGAGIVNAAYLLGITDDNWEDHMFALRKGLSNHIGVEGAELVLDGALRFTGADFTSKMSQESFLFRGSPENRKARDLAQVLGLTALGAPGHMMQSGFDGFQKVREGISDYNAGAETQGMSKGIEGAGNIVQIKIVNNILKAAGMMMGGGTKGLPKDAENTTGNAFITALGFQPTITANKLDAKRTTNREVQKESQARNTWVNRFRDAPNSAEEQAIWRQVQREYNPGVPDELRIKYQDLFKAKQRKAKDEKRDEKKIGVALTGRRKAFADVGGYFRTE